MKKLLLGAAAALAIGAPGVASAQTGYVDLGYSSTEAEIGGIDLEGDGWTVGGAAAWGGQGSVGFQVDATVGQSEDVSNYNIGGHLFSRSASFLFGGFANYGNVDPDGGADSDLWTVGLESQWYMARTTIDGALSYSDAEDADATLTALDLGLTHFVTDNFSLGGNVGFGQIEVAGLDADALAYGLSGEWQFASAPISVFGGWQHADVDDADFDADTLSVGVRYNWGGTLLERNRSGASLARGGGLGRYGGLF
ncbi:MAG: hypothetical protein ACT4OF_15480 [Caulobacteraceae bacterium]